MDRCELSDLPTDQCSHCWGLDGPEPTPELIVAVKMYARRAGSCEICGEWTIREGDPLYGVRDADTVALTWAGKCCVGDR